MSRDLAVTEAQLGLLVTCYAVMAALDHAGPGALPVLAAVLTGLGLLALLIGRRVDVPAPVTG